MAAANEGVVQLRVKRSRILELRIGRLPPDGGTAETADDLGIEAAREVGSGGQALDSKERFQTWYAQVRGLLASQHVSETEAGFQQRGWRHSPGIANGRLLLNGV